MSDQANTTAQARNGRQDQSDGLTSSGPATTDGSPRSVDQVEKAETEYPNTLNLAIICIGLFLTIICVGLDRSIVATAIPKITSEFNSLGDVGWYGSAYLLTQCCFQLMFGKLYAEFNVKCVFLAGLLIFELGSVVCAVASSSAVLIVGRAIAGLGGSGLMTGALVILAQSVPLHKRPVYTGAIGGANGLSIAIAPTLGGAFTDYVTWRWCFWINLPLGGVTMAVILFFLKLPTQARTGPVKTIRQMLEKFDLVGTFFLVPSLICLLLALEWGGIRYPWNSWHIILLLCLFGLSFLIWGFWQYRAGEKATVPLRIIRQRSIASGVWFIFCLFSGLFLQIYYIPIWFQAAKDTSAYQSGVKFLATTVAQAVTSVLAGFLTTKVGYYVPQMIASTVLMSVACGMITTFDLNTSAAFWAASLVLLGLGVGIGGQQPILAAQTVLKGTDIPLGTSVMIFASTMSGTFFLAVAQSVFQSGLVSQLRERVPAVDPAVVVGNGASNLVAAMTKVYPDDVAGILESYNGALRKVFVMALVLCCATVFGSAFIEWTSVKKEKAAKAAKESTQPDDQALEGGSPLALADEKEDAHAPVKEGAPAQPQIKD